MVVDENVRVGGPVTSLSRPRGGLVPGPDVKLLPELGLSIEQQREHGGKFFQRFVPKLKLRELPGNK